MIHRTIASGVLLLALGFLAHSTGFGQPRARLNSIQVAADTSKKGVIKVYGSYSTKMNVTLTKVEVWAFRTTGGLFPPQTVTNAKAGQPGAWGDATLDVRVFKGQYAIRADGYFSDGEVLTSGYIQLPVDGDPYVGEIDLTYKAGFPKSDASLTIKCEGEYTGPVDNTAKGPMYLTPADGGKLTIGSISSAKADLNKGFWVSHEKVPTGGLKYEVVGFVSDDKAAKKYYSTPFSSLFVLP